MAGIGFELRRMIDERQGFVNKARAYLCAGLISSGPWLMTILTLTLLNVAGPYLGGSGGYSLFRALVTYAFAFSLVLQGAVQMAVTRQVADLLYKEQHDRVLPAFAAMMLVVGVTHGVLAGAFCLWAGFTPAVAALAVSLFAIVGMTWMALIWLSIVRQYDEVLRAYVWGTLVSMVGVLFVFLGRGTTGILAAYTAGQAFILALLVRTILRGMEAGGGCEFSIWRSLAKFPLLVGVGLAYNGAIWADKMIFWFRDGVGPHPLVRYHPLYDTCSFLAYLTVVPALAVNLIRLETSFYEKYRAYYGAILGGTPLSVIEDRKKRMFENLKESIVRLLRVQGAITITVILFAPLVIDFLELPPVAVRVFRLTCLGAFFHVLLLITVLMQLYFDLRKQAFATSMVFLALNIALAFWSVSRGVETYGVGYATASFLALLLGYVMLHGSLERLDYLTFVNQPIADDEDRHRLEEKAEKKQPAKSEAKDAPAAEETASPEAVPEPEIESVPEPEIESAPESDLDLEPAEIRELETATEAGVFEEKTRDDPALSVPIAEETTTLAEEPVVEPATATEADLPEPVTVAATDKVVIVPEHEAPEVADDDETATEAGDVGRAPARDDEEAP